MGDYSKMPQEWFDQTLVDIVGDTSAGELILIPRVYEILSEHFNNEILEDWDAEQEIIGALMSEVEDEQ